MHLCISAVNRGEMGWFGTLRTIADREYEKHLQPFELSPGTESHLRGSLEHPPCLHYRRVQSQHSTLPNSWKLWIPARPSRNTRARSPHPVRTVPYRLLMLPAPGFATNRQKLWI